MNDKASITNYDEYDNGMMKRACPYCGELNPIEDFGYRDMGIGVVRNQAWCKECRGD